MICHEFVAIGWKIHTHKTHSRHTLTTIPLISPTRYRTTHYSNAIHTDTLTTTPLISPTRYLTTHYSNAIHTDTLTTIPLISPTRYLTTHYSNAIHTDTLTTTPVISPTYYLTTHYSNAIHTDTDNDPSHLTHTLSDETLQQRDPNPQTNHLYLRHVLADLAAAEGRCSTHATSERWTQHDTERDSASSAERGIHPKVSCSRFQRQKDCFTIQPIHSPVLAVGQRHRRIRSHD